MLFVYGTLRSEFDNQYARLLRSQTDFIGKTTVRGSIYRVTFFPAWKPEPAGEVHGELYRLRDPEKTLKALDEYEGEDFARVVTTVAEIRFPGTELSLAKPSSSDVWIYQYKKTPPKYSRISSGDFCAPDAKPTKP